MLFRESLQDAHVSEGRYPSKIPSMVLDRGAKHNQMWYRIFDIDRAKWAIFSYASFSNARILPSHICYILPKLAESRTCSTFSYIDLATKILHRFEPRQRH